MKVKSKGINENRIIFLIFLFAFFEFIRPQTLVPALSSLRIPLLLAIILFAIWLLNGNKEVLKHPLIKRNLWFLFFIIIGLLFAVNHFSVVEKFKLNATYLVAFCLPFISWVNSYSRLNKFFILWLSIHFIIALMSVGSAGKGVGSFLQDENDLALVLTMAIPYAFFMANIPGIGFKYKLILYACLGVFVLAVILSFSRGGFIGLACVIFMLWLSSKEKVKKLLIGLFLFLLMIPFIPEKYYSEVQSITDTEESTAYDRLYMWRRGLEMFVDNPILGVGAGNYNWNVSIYEERSKEFDNRTMNHGGRVSHSLYFTIIPEFGLAGIIIFYGIFTIIYKRGGRIWKAYKKNPDSDDDFIALAHLAKAAQVSLIGYLTAGAFISVLYYPHLWYLIAIFISIEMAVLKNHSHLLESKKNM